MIALHLFEIRRCADVWCPVTLLSYVVRHCLRSLNYVAINCCSMNKVRIKSLPGKRPERDKLLHSLTSFNIKCFKLVELKSDIFQVWCNTDSDVDLLFSEACVKELKKIHCEPQLPPEVRAKRTVMLRRIDDIIMSKEERDIIAELQEKNDWLRIADIFVFPNTPTVKLVFTTNEMAVKALSNGVKLFNLSIPPSNIAQKEYINLIACYKCYTIEDHQAATCNKPKEYKICSICAMTGHTFKQCTSNTKKCINCGGPHSTLAMSCPDRKRIIRERKRNSINQKTYSAATNPNNSNSLPSPSVGGGAAMIKTFMCVTISTMKNAEVPGSFETTLNRLLQANGLPNFSMGGVPPPSMHCLAQLNYDSTGNTPEGDPVEESVGDSGTIEKDLNESTTTELTQTTAQKERTSSKYNSVNPQLPQTAFCADNEDLNCDINRPIKSLFASTGDTFSRKMTDNEARRKNPTHSGDISKRNLRSTSFYQTT